LMKSSALQRAEIAEIRRARVRLPAQAGFVSVLFNEPKLLKSSATAGSLSGALVSVLFNEPKLLKLAALDESDIRSIQFQCSSTSRNC